MNNKNCGNQVANDAVDDAQTDQKKESYAGEAAISFFIPIIGLIFYMIWKKTEPERASVCGLWAVIGFVSAVVIIVIIGG